MLLINSHKRLIATLVTCAAFSITANTASAQLLATEGFTYADGSFTGASGGTGFDTNWGNANGNTESGAVTIASGATNGAGNIFRGLTDAFGATGSVWMQFDYRTNGTASYSGLQLFNGTSEIALIGGRGNETWQMSGGGAGITTSSVDSTTIKTAVLQLDIGAGEISVWVGSGVGTIVDIEVAADLTRSGYTLAGIDTIRIGSGQSQTIDNFEYALTAADLSAVAVPEPSSMALLAGVATMTLIGSRRKRHNS